MSIRFPFVTKSTIQSRILPIKNYTIYYDAPSESVLTKLKTFDLVIIEPHLYGREQITQIKTSGTMTIGYLSVMQAPSWNMERFIDLLLSDFLLKNGEKQHFPEWDSYLMDLRQAHYQALLLKEIKLHITEKGFDGILLDTVADIDERIIDPLLQIKIRDAYLSFLQQIRSHFPHLIFIQNRGFSTLEMAKPYIAGMLWEDWQGDWKQDPWMKHQVDRIKNLKKKDFLVLSVSTDQTALHHKEAKKLGYIHTFKPNGYQVL
jgi:polysaccharide biosynthesis protein PelA